MAAASVFERHPRLTIGALVLVAALGTDVAFTHAWRALRPTPQRGPKAARRTPDSDTDARIAPAFRIKSGVFHHGLKPLWDSWNSWGPRSYRFCTNSLGFLDREPREVPLVPDGRRIVFIGDSFTEGSGVAYAQTFVGLIDAALAPDGVSVLNAATVSYSPIIYLRKMRYYIDRGLRFDELVVFLDISDIQDEVLYRFDERGFVVWDEARKAREDEANRRYGGEPEPEPEWVPGVDAVMARHTTALLRAWRGLAGVAFAGRMGAQTGRRRGMWTLDPVLYQEFGREGLERAADHMSQLLALLQEHGMRLTLAVYPWPDQILNRDLDSRQVRFWRGWAQARGVPLLDYFPVFIDGTPPTEVLARDFIPGDTHWNEAGHQRVARVFLERYRQRAD